MSSLGASSTAHAQKIDALPMIAPQNYAAKNKAYDLCDPRRCAGLAVPLRCQFTASPFRLSIT